MGIIAIISLIAFYYYVSLFLHIGNHKQYLSLLSKILQGGLLVKGYESNLMEIEEYADDKTIFLLNRIILTAKLL